MGINQIRQSPVRKPNPLQRLCLLGSLSILSSLSGIVPAISLKDHSIQFETQAYAQTTLTAQAQTFSLETIWRYAKAVQEINPIREEHNRKIDQILKTNRPARVCYQNNIPWEVKQNCDSFGSKMLAILKQHQVYEAYTPISLQVQFDENLKKKIQKAGICQQRGISLSDCF